MSTDPTTASELLQAAAEADTDDEMEALLQAACEAEED